MLAPLTMRAQSISDFFKRPSRKALQTENSTLKASLDSLQSLVDSLEERRYIEDNELRAVIEGNSAGEAEDSLEYTAEVSDSLIADGSRIEGTVENSIIFRGCTIAKDAIVKDSIVLPNSSIGEGVELSYVVTDKGVTVRENRKMIGGATYPVAIAKNATV